jgi:hypothetical protein
MFSFREVWAGYVEHTEFWQRAASFLSAEKDIPRRDLLHALQLFAALDKYYFHNMAQISRIITVEGAIFFVSLITFYGHIYFYSWAGGSIYEAVDILDCGRLLPSFSCFSQSCVVFFL